jgi:hypothetical protein
MSKFEESGKWGRDWQRGDDWSSHTVLRSEAERIASGYQLLLRKLGHRPDKTDLRGLGIGAGAAHLEAALAEMGYRMTASEWNEYGLKLVGQQNPQLDRKLVDLMTFHEPAGWDLIVARELYPFTRVDSFTEQWAMIGRLTESLRPGGVLLLSGSNVSRPECLDYRRMLRELRADKRVDAIIGPVLEPLLKRFASLPFGAAAWRLQNAGAEFALAALNAVRSRRIAGIRLYAIRRSGR